MAASRVTFTLDKATVARLDQSAAHLAIPKDQVVCRAIQVFVEHAGNLDERAARLSEPERLRILKVMDRMILGPPSRTQQEVDRELKGIRTARRRGGRQTRAN
jgi:hypothetical protein